MASVDALRQQASALFDKGAYAEAAEHCQRALQEDPHNVRLRLLLGGSQYWLGQPGRAVGTFRQLIAEDEGDDASHSALLQMMLGLCLWWLGQWREAESALKRSVELEPCSLHYYLLGRFQAKVDPASVAAEQALRRAIELAPDYGEAFCDLGSVLMYQVRHQEALDLLRRAAELEPGDSFAFTLLGRVLVEMHQYDAAKEALSTALRLKEDDVRTHVTFAELLARQGPRGEEEARHLKRVIELSPG
jgi:protein O-GlcNAc transferase